MTGPGLPLTTGEGAGSEPTKERSDARPASPENLWDSVDVYFGPKAEYPDPSIMAALHDLLASAASAPEGRNSNPSSSVREQEA